MADWIVKADGVPLDMSKKIKLVIAGGRDIDESLAVTIINEAMVDLGLVACINVVEIVHGGCPNGVDAAVAKHFRGVVPMRVFPADWQKHGKAAGPIRNAQMAEYGDELLLVWDGKSRGSASMKREMEKAGKPIHEQITKGVPCSDG